MKSQWLDMTETTTENKKDSNFLRKVFSVEGIRDFFKLRDKEGNFSWEQLIISILQISLFILTVYILDYLELPLTNLLNLF